jgi:hypothetical protein
MSDRVSANGIARIGVPTHTASRTGGMNWFALLDRELLSIDVGTTNWEAFGHDLTLFALFNREWRPLVTSTYLRTSYVSRTRNPLA